MGFGFGSSGISRRVVLWRAVWGTLAISAGLSIRPPPVSAPPLESMGMLSAKFFFFYFFWASRSLCRFSTSLLNLSVISFSKFSMKLGSASAPLSTYVLVILTWHSFDTFWTSTVWHSLLDVLRRLVWVMATLVCAESVWVCVSWFSRDSV